MKSLIRKKPENSCLIAKKIASKQEFASKCDQILLSKCGKKAKKFTRRALTKYHINARSCNINSPRHLKMFTGNLQLATIFFVYYIEAK